MTAKDYFERAVICQVIATCYEHRGLVGNAHYFAARAAYFVAKGLEAIAIAR